MGTVAEAARLRRRELLPLLALIVLVLFFSLSLLLRRGSADHVFWSDGDVVHWSSAAARPGPVAPEGLQGVRGGVARARPSSSQHGNAPPPQVATPAPVAEPLRDAASVDRRDVADRDIVLVAPPPPPPPPAVLLPGIKPPPMRLRGDMLAMRAAFGLPDPATSGGPLVSAGPSSPSRAGASAASRAAQQTMVRSALERVGVPEEAKGTCIDVGAQTTDGAQFLASLPACKRVLAVDGDGRNVNKMRTKGKMSPIVDVLHKAVSFEAGPRVTFSTQKSNIEYHEARGHLYRPDNLVDVREGWEGTEVDSTTVAELAGNERVPVLLVDCQGGEWAPLLGALPLLREGRIDAISLKFVDPGPTGVLICQLLDIWGATCQHTVPLVDLRKLGGWNGRPVDSLPRKLEPQTQPVGCFDFVQRAAELDFGTFLVCRRTSKT